MEIGLMGRLGEQAGFAFVFDIKSAGELADEAVVTRECG